MRTRTMITVTTRTSSAATAGTMDHWRYGQHQNSKLNHMSSIESLEQYDVIHISQSCESFDLDYTTVASSMASQSQHQQQQEQQQQDDRNNNVNEEEYDLEQEIWPIRISLSREDEEEEEDPQKEEEEHPEDEIRDPYQEQQTQKQGQGQQGYHQDPTFANQYYSSNNNKNIGTGHQFRPDSALELEPPSMLDWELEEDDQNEITFEETETDDLSSLTMEWTGCNPYFGHHITQLRIALASHFQTSKDKNNKNDHNNDKESADHQNQTSTTTDTMASLMSTIPTRRMQSKMQVLLQQEEECKESFEVPLP